MKSKGKNNAKKVNFQDWTIYLSLKKQAALICLFLCSLSFQAQVATTANNSALLEENAFIDSLRTIDLTASSSFSRADYLHGLIYNIQPSVYVLQGEINTYGERPTNLYTSVSSLSAINNSSILKNNIEIITIRIENSSELNQFIDIAAFDSYSKLKFVYLISNVASTAQQLNAMLHNKTEACSVFYTVQIGDNN